MIFNLYIWILCFVSAFVSILWLILNYYSNKYKKEISLLNNHPFVTVAVPAFNEQEVIASTLRSIFNQDYPKDKLEVIVVNDNSSDDTIKEINKFVKETNFNVKLINHNKNKGKGGALNTALKIAKGEFFCVYDADSISSKDLLKNMVPYFYYPENKDVGAVVAITLIKNTGNWIEKMQVLEYVMAAFTRKLMGSADISQITNALSLFRTKILKEIKGFDEENLTEDFEIAMRLRYNNYRIVMCEEGRFHTSVPKKIRSVWRQRVRWFRGFIYNNNKYKSMILNKKFGLLGLFQIPLEIFILLAVFFSIGLFFYHVYDLIYDFIYRLIIYRLGILDFDIPTIQQFILNLNWLIIFPTIVVLLLGLYLYHSAHKYVGEKWKFYIPSLLYLFVYPLFRSLQWIHAFALELIGAKRKW